MKSKLKTRILTLVVIVIATILIGTATGAQAADEGVINAGKDSRAVTEAEILPVKDPNWKDPDKVLDQVGFDDLPLRDVVQHLKEQFKDAFDVLIPNRWDDPNDQSRMVSPSEALIQMRLKNVTASEVFNAMNIMFQTQNAPFRWELIMNGKRPTAVLRIIPALVSRVPQPKPSERKIYFVGGMLGDEKSGGMTMEQLIKTLVEVYELSHEKSQESITKHLQVHKQAQLLVVTGTIDQITFIQQTMDALKKRMDFEDERRYGRGRRGPFGGEGGRIPISPTPNSKEEGPKAP